MKTITAYPRYSPFKAYDDYYSMREGDDFHHLTICPRFVKRVMKLSFAKLPQSITIAVSSIPFPGAQGCVHYDLKSGNWSWDLNYWQVSFDRLRELIRSEFGFSDNSQPIRSVWYRITTAK